MGGVELSYPIRLQAIVQESQCPLCRFTFRDPLSAGCKHPACKSCLAVLFTRDLPALDRVFCLSCKAPLNLQELKPDRSAQRKLEQITSCKCKNCSWKGSYTDYIQKHKRNCGEGARIQCKVLGCGKWLPEKRALDVHRTDEWCPMILIMKARLDHAEIVHQSMRETWDWTCGLVLRSDRLHVRKLIDRLVRVYSVLDPKVPAALENDGYFTVEQSSLTVDCPGKSKKREIKVLKRKVEDLWKSVDDFTRMNKPNGVDDSLQKKIRELQRCITTLRQNGKEIYRRLEMQETSCSGVFLWKVSNYTEKKRDAMNTNVKSICSPPFYTSQYGYKLCGRVFLMGDGVGKGTHISLFLTIMKGSFDAVLPWPFKEMITFQLVNRDDPINKSIVEAFRPDPASSSFKKPTTEKNIGAGCPLFAKIQKIEDPKSGFIRDNTMYLRIICQTSDVPEIK